MGMYSTFKTDEAAERDGVWVTYDTFRVRIARAGGTNRSYAKALEIKSRPLRRAIETGTLSNDRALGMMREVYAETIVKGWETLDDDGDWVRGIEMESGDIAPASKETIVETFAALPDLFADIQAQAQALDLYRAELAEADAGN